MTHQRRSVRFSDRNEVTVVEAAEATAADLWYTEMDLEELKRGSCFNHDTEHSAFLSPYSCDTVRRNRKEFVNALLQQQTETKMLGFEDPKGLYQFSKACSKKSRQRALREGRSMEEEVKEVIRDALDLLGAGL